MVCEHPHPTSPTASCQPNLENTASSTDCSLIVILRTTGDPARMPSPNSETPGRLPDFIVVGATKAATTSLDQYLALHPQIHMARPKEPRYFVEGVIGSTSHRGLEWYRSLFQSERTMCGETSPQYTYWPTRTGVAARIQEVIPHCRLIYLVREPWSRLKSHYFMKLRTGRTADNLATHLSAAPQVRDASCYGTQLAELMRYFPRDQILVVESARLQRKSREALREVFRFLCVDPNFDTPGFDHQYHVRQDQSALSPTGMRLLNSSAVKFLESHLSQWAFYHARNMLSWPFRRTIPPLEIPAALQSGLTDLFRREVDLLRNLTSQDLPSLEVQPPDPTDLSELPLQHD